MEGNKDEAERCLGIAQGRLADGDLEGAAKFVKKSLLLFPTDKARVFARNLESRMNNAAADGAKAAAAGSSGGNTPSRTSSDAGSAQTTPSRAASVSPQPVSLEYTPEQAAAVKRVLKLTSYYEVLEIAKDANENDIKKAYRRLALQFHPDKNGAPGADEAFKLISDAFAVLSDPSKRQHYDTFGRTPSRGSGASESFGRGGGGGGRHPFESEISPEELFEMFFNGRMPMGAGMRGAGGRPHVQMFTTGMRRQQQGRQPPRSNESQNFLYGILQLLPLFVLLLYYLSASPDQPLYSLQQIDKFTVARKTASLGVDYYLEPSVQQKYTKDARSLAQLERTVEDDHIQRLQQQCKEEETKRSYLLRRAYTPAEVTRVKAMPTPWCDKLHEIRNKKRV